MTDSKKPTVQEWMIFAEQHRGVTMKVKDLVGLTVVKAQHIDNDMKGVVLTFDDGTVFEVTEQMQAGQLMVWLNEDHCGEGDGGNE